METRRNQGSGEVPAAPLSLSGAISRLGVLLEGPRWSASASLKEAVDVTAILLNLLVRSRLPRAQRHAVLLGRALERIGKGMWPPTAETRGFLAECLGAIANRCGVAFVPSDEKAAAEQVPPPAQAPPAQPPPDRPARAAPTAAAQDTPDGAAASRPPSVSNSPQRAARERVQAPAPRPLPLEPIVLVLSDEEPGLAGAGPSRCATLALPRSSLYVL